MAETLTTTSYTILGLLALKPWTTYELAKQMERGFRYIWPRAESKLYAEPRKLVVHGLAKATDEMVGKRSRTIYSITPKGRRALRTWLEEEGDGPQVEFEALVKVALGDQGSREALLANLAAAKRWSAARLNEDATLVQSYLAEGPPFPDRLPVIMLSGSFLYGFAKFVGEWARWAEAQVRDWPDDVRDAMPDLDFMFEVADSPATG